LTTCRIEFLPVGTQVRCPQGTLLYYAARDAGIALVSVCGGMGRCGKCIVIIEHGMVSPPTPLERQKLSENEIASGHRLACQTRVQGNLKVFLPPSSILSDQQFDLVCAEPGVAVDPAVQDIVISLHAPWLHNPSSCLEQLAAEIKNSCNLSVDTADEAVLRDLPARLSESNGCVRASIRDGEIISVRPPVQNPLGVAIDLGTTKIAAYLIDMLTGKLYSTAGMANPQCAFGDDVMSRIACAMEHGSAQLRQTVIDGLNQLIKELCQDPHKIIEVVIVGNTVMHHLILDLPVKQLGSAPYVPALCAPLDVKARDLGLDIAPGGYVHLVPNVAGFIGGDHVAMILATGIHTTPRTVLGIDIGTNTEIVLAHAGKLFSTSCASGPAFEGGHITCGMRAATGAIEKVTIRDTMVAFETIGGMPPIGLCGSGILDAVAELFRCEIITKQGRMLDAPGVRARGNKKEFVLVPMEKSCTGKDITITQLDIHEIQLAKAAIRTGIEALLSVVKIGIDAIEEVMVAGGFGTRINPASGIAIGMFPPFQLDQFKHMGNAAGMGAMRILISRSQRTLAAETAQRIQYLELMTYPGFHKQFAKALYIPAKQLIYLS
jgi:uncharacterized 2Fe-2S/4Fe-4S cluster protein (DUF4445 family)